MGYFGGYIYKTHVLDLIMADIGEIKDVIEKASLYSKSGPAEEHKIVFDSNSETLEPLYFWVLDFINGMYGGKIDKLVDNFTSSVGSGHFSELRGKATAMQEQAMKILGNVNTVIKSIVNLIYDLKEFEIRLDQYKEAKSSNPIKAEAGLLALKQIWMDSVDIKKGRGSINMMTQDLQFATLRDAFMAANSVEEAKKLDLNDRVKRILEPRLLEFFEWKERSEKELQKRYEIEKTYLKSQVNSLKLYTRWAKPYLLAASQLEQRDLGRNPALVNTFNTIILQLTLFGKKAINVDQAIVDKDLPRSFKGKEFKRKYYNCILIDFVFRGIPQRAGQHYVFGGRAEITFRGYALNDDELKMMEQKLNESDLSDALKLVSGVTDESLAQLKDDIDHFLESENKEEKAKKEEDPFSAFLNLFKSDGKKKESEKKDEKITEVEKDSYIEELLRKIATKKAKESCFAVFDVFKKGHDMASHPNPFG